MLTAIVEHQLRELVLVPPLIIRLVEDPIVSRFDLSSVRRFSSGAAPLPPRIFKLLQEKFPDTGFKQGWGMTESCSCITVHDPAHFDYKYATTVGPLIPSTFIKIVNEEGEEVSEGEILVKGPQCATLGYLGKPEATKQAFDEDGWLRTGDVGRMLANGCVRITGRIKEIIKVKGVGISPGELEEILLSHPQVQDVAVIGLPDDYTGERPHAFVVVDAVSPSTVFAEELKQLVKERKNRSNWIAEMKFVDAIPRAASGKILRRQLRDQVLPATARL